MVETLKLAWTWLEWFEGGGTQPQRPVRDVWDVLERLKNPAVIDWPWLARAEHAASRVGGERWQKFVREAEAYTGMPWATIRKELDAHVRQYLATLGHEQ